jgi:hypothetical protein
MLAAYVAATFPLLEVTVQEFFPIRFELFDLADFPFAPVLFHPVRSLHLIRRSFPLSLF